MKNPKFKRGTVVCHTVGGIIGLIGYPRYGVVATIKTKIDGSFYYQLLSGMDSWDVNEDKLRRIGFDSKLPE